MFRVGKRRAAIAGASVALLIMGALAVLANAASGEGTTNGSPVTFGQVQCNATVNGSIHLTQAEDITAQAVVPNQVTQGASYTATIPGGTTTLPSTGGGLPVSGYKNLRQIYLFHSDSGTVTVTGASTNPAGASATNNGNSVEYDVSNTASTVTLATPVASPGSLTTPDVTVNLTAPSADATVTTFVQEIDTTATVSLGDAVVVCAVPHSNPQTDGISATIVGAGGATTSSQPSCRPEGTGACPTTTTTTMKSTTSTGVGGSTTTTVPTGPTISIADTQVTRPDKGTAKATFVVSISAPPASGKASVHFETADGTATAPNDYKHKQGTVSFSRTSLSKKITVSVVGGTIGEPNKNFFVNLSLAKGASILDGQGEATIVDNHTPGVSIGDATVPVPTRSTVLKFTVTVTKAAPRGQTCKVGFATHDLTAKAGVDYNAKHGNVTFQANKTTATISITVKPTAVSGNVFIVQLSNPTKCQIVDGLGAGTIS